MRITGLTPQQSRVVQQTIVQRGKLNIAVIRSSRLVIIQSPYLLFRANALLLIQETEEDNDNPYGKRDVITDLLALLKGLTSLDLSGLGPSLGSASTPMMLAHCRVDMGLSA